MHELLNEIEIGGALDGSYLDDLHAQDFDSRQLDLFDHLPSLSPALPKGFEEVGRIGSFVVVRDHRGGKANEPIFILYDKGYPVGYAALLPPGQGADQPWRYDNLEDYVGSNGFQVKAVQIDRDYSKQALSIKLYEWMLLNFCDYLVADDMQTRGGVAIWRKLLNSRRFEVQVFDCDKHVLRRRRSGKDFAQVYNSNQLIPILTVAGRMNDLLDKQRN